MQERSIIWVDVIKVNGFFYGLVCSSISNVPISITYGSEFFIYRVSVTISASFFFFYFNFLFKEMESSVKGRVFERRFASSSLPTRIVISSFTFRFFFFAELQSSNGASDVSL